MADFFELSPVEGKRRYLLRNQDGLELALYPAPRVVGGLSLAFDPDLVDFEITPTGGYRFFAKGETALESAPDKAAASSLT